MFKCPFCGNERFYARQVCRHDIIVDGEANYVGEANDCSVYSSGSPYGPYQCRSCGAAFEELDDGVPAINGPVSGWAEKAPAFRELAAGKYVVLPISAVDTLDGEEYEDFCNSNGDEDREAFLILEKSFLESWISGNYHSLEEFAVEYTSDDVDGIIYKAQEKGALAFIHRPDFAEKSIILPAGDPDRDGTFGIANMSADTLSLLMEYLAK